MTKLSRRLMSILKAAFHDNPRCVALVNAFSEGVALHGVGQLVTEWFQWQ